MTKGGCHLTLRRNNWTNTLLEKPTHVDSGYFRYFQYSLHSFLFIFLLIYCGLFWTNPQSIISHNNSYMDTFLPSLNLSKLDEQDMPDTAGRSQDELTNNIPSWTASHKHTDISQPTKTYIHQLCADTGYRLEDLTSERPDFHGLEEREKESMRWMLSAQIHDDDNDDDNHEKAALPDVSICLSAILQMNIISLIVVSQLWLAVCFIENVIANQMTKRPVHPLS